MAHIYAIAGEKGGGAKSTTTQNLGVQRTLKGKRVLVIEADPQKTTFKWWLRRMKDKVEPNVEVVCKSARELLAFLEEVDSQYDEIYIDTGGADSNEMRIALMVANVVVCPCEPSQADIETLEHVNTLIGRAKQDNPEMRAYILTTKASTNAKDSEAAEMREFCKNFEHLELLQTVIKSRKTFKDALRDGKGVVEYPVTRDTAKAIAETKQFEEEIFND